MMQFALIASGSKGNCFLLRDGTTKIMVDCGTTRKYLFDSLEKLGVAASDLDAVLVTHDHSDHVSQIRFFRDMVVYSPVELYDVETLRVDPLRRFHVNSLEIMPLALSHDAPNTVGYVFDNGAERLVYVTDTGYFHGSYIPLARGADYIVMESNHDIGMLMRTRRPQYLKMRICSDYGHLNNEDCADILDKIVNENTKMVILAHISQEANTRELALSVSRQGLLAHEGRLDPGLLLCAAGQFEMIQKGWNDEKNDPGACYCAIGMEHLAHAKV